MKKPLTLLFIFLLCFQCLIMPLTANAAAPVLGDGDAVSVAKADVIDDVAELFGVSANASAPANTEEVYLGGYPIGITIDGDGVTVIGLNEFVGADGKLCCPAMNAGITINDVVVELDGKKIYNSAKLAEIASKSEGRELIMKYLRDGAIAETVIKPQRDLTTNQYRLGLWSKDSSSGIGTLTYVRKNLNFGSLGHPITDPKGNIVSCKNGGVFHCTIDGVEKGRKGSAGELKGSFSFDKRIGNIYANNKFGAFGTFTSMPSFCKDTIEVADIAEIKPGKAQIYCTLSDNVRKSYDIEIVKAVAQSSRDDRGMVIHVTDKELLNQTGGIVQGMSGSPIVQNGKLVGAVTHVFVNDPTRGYGMYAKWMLTN